VQQRPLGGSAKSLVRIRPAAKSSHADTAVRTPIAIGNLEAKVKSFCDPAHALRFFKDFIIFAEKEEELQKFILRQHQAAAMDKVVEPALDPQRTRGLVWHTKGSGKTYTMIKAAELLCKANEAQKPTILPID
jgi:type I restriction enzyme R subunit